MNMPSFEKHSFLKLLISVTLDSVYELGKDWASQMNCEADSDCFNGRQQGQRGHEASGLVFAQDTCHL
jgi:hypothetical protein